MDWIHSDGKIHDSARIDYLSRHLYEVGKAIDHKIDIRGYFQWSIMDNFEWELGYARRFGLIYVDYKSMNRRQKDSFFWYRDVIESQGKIITKPHHIS